MNRFVVIYLIFLATGISAFSMKKSGDFVESVTCHAGGMDVVLKSRLPPPREGMWDLSVENHPRCPGATKSDVGGAYRFSILYVDKEWCGVEPKSWFTPAWVSYAEVVLILQDQNGTKIADSISCVYNTRFEASLLTFQGDVASENLRYGGSVDEEGTDVESMVHSGDAIHMDFYGSDGRALERRQVKLGDPLIFRISVSELDHVTNVLPEMCYFSSSSVPDENPAFGQTLVFVKKSCFNDKNAMVRTLLPKMDRSQNGTSYELPFSAFHFSEYGQNLFVHCTMLACVGRQLLCEPKPNCFGTNRRKRSTDEGVSKISKPAHDSSKELVMTKYIVITDQKHPNVGNLPTVSLEHVIGHGAVCMQTPHFAALLGSMAACILLLISGAACLVGRLARRKHRPEVQQPPHLHMPPWLSDKPLFYPARAQSPYSAYTTGSVRSLQALGF